MPKLKAEVKPYYGLWMTLEEVTPSERTYDPKHKGHRRRIFCICTGCNKTADVLLENLNRGKSSGCSKCRAKKK